MRKYYSIALILLIPILASAQDCAITDVKLDSLNRLCWTVVNPTDPLSFEVKQLKWNKWITVEKYVGQMIEPTYQLQNDAVVKVTVPVHSGINKFIIVGFEQTNCVSDTIEVNGPSTESCGPLKVGEAMFLGAYLDYEVFDSNGKLLLSGNGKTIDMKSLEKGIYYLHTPNHLQKFIKK